jgi:hypothetical protein
MFTPVTLFSNKNILEVIKGFVAIILTLFSVCTPWRGRTKKAQIKNYKACPKLCNWKARYIMCKGKGDLKGHQQKTDRLKEQYCHPIIW